MANERSYTTRNVGTREKPVWERWFAITVADAVLMSDKEGETKTIVDYINKRIAELIGTTQETEDILNLTEISKYIEAYQALVNKINDELENKVNKEQGKMLSTNDYTLEEKEKLNGIEDGAEANVQADWNEKNVTSDAYVKNKPSALKNPEVLTFIENGIYDSYDGSEAKMIAIPKSVSELENDIGFACTESPTFTGVPEAPTPETGANNTQIATTAFVKTLISNLVNGAPEALDTLKEIADALGENDDAVQALNEAIGKKLSKTETAAAAAKWEVGRNLNGLIVDGTSNLANYGTCSTPAATAVKTVDCAGFGLTHGAEITVKFTVTNTAANPALNVGGTGAKAIFYRGAAIPAGYLAANRTYIFRYNGMQWELIGDINTDTTYGLATSSARGLVKIGYPENGKNYPVQLNNEQMFVNVPWTDTTYSNFVKSGSGAKAGLVPSPGGTAGTTKYLREDGTWVATSTSLAGNIAGIPADQTAVKFLYDKITEQNSNLSNRIVTLYNNPDPFLNYVVTRESVDSPAYIIQLSDIPANFIQLEIIYGLITTNSTGNKWSPVVGTMIYPNCNNYNLYMRTMVAVSNTDYASIQINANRNTKNLSVYVFNQSTSNVVGFYIMCVKGIRF